MNKCLGGNKATQAAAKLTEALRTALSNSLSAAINVQLKSAGVYLATLCNPIRNSSRLYKYERAFRNEDLSSD